MYVCTFIHAYKHTYKHTRIYVRMYLHTCIHTCIHTYIHTYIHTHTHIHCTYMHTCITTRSRDRVIYVVQLDRIALYRTVTVVSGLEYLDDQSPYPLCKCVSSKPFLSQSQPWIHLTVRSLTSQ